MLLTIHKIAQIKDQDVLCYQIDMPSGFSVSMLNLGATLMAVQAKDRNGLYENVLLGYADPLRYIDNPLYMGATIGRTSGRIGGARWVKTKLTPNSQGGHHIHGGARGFSHQIWYVQTEEPHDPNLCTVVMTLSSSDGDEGYPGELKAKVTYTIHDEGRLVIGYEASANQETLVNLTNHAYFNLSGGLSETVEQHELMIDSDRYLELGSASVPTGHVKTVDNSPFDFRIPTALGARIHEKHQQLRRAGGYDHPWLLNCPESVALALDEVADRPQVSLYCPSSGRKMEVYTDQPCAVVYTMNGGSDEVMETGQAAAKYGAVCIECQNPPISEGGHFVEDSVLKPGEVYRREIDLRFKVLL